MQLFTNLPGRLAISLVVYVLKLCLALTPLLGMAWTHRLRHKDAEICGPYVFWTSKWIWSAIASCEMTLGIATGGKSS